MSLGGVKKASALLSIHFPAIIKVEESSVKLLGNRRKHAVCLGQMLGK